jgi:hypothetical protein
MKRLRIIRIRSYVSHQAGVDVAQQELANRIDAMGCNEVNDILQGVTGCGSTHNVLVEDSFVIDKDPFVQILAILVVVVGDLAEGVLRA